MTATTRLAVPAPPPRTWSNAARTFFRRGLATAALVVLVITVVLCYAAPLIFPAGPNVVDLSQSLQGPSPEHWLGTDQLGRDLLARVLYGGQVTLLNALIVTVVALAIAVPLGLIAGYSGSWKDRLISLAAEIGLAVPSMVVMLVVISLFADAKWVAMIALGILLTPPIVRNVRGPAIAVRGELYIDAALVAGLPAGRIVFKHVLPRVIGPVLVQGVLVAAVALQFAVGLAFLGFGATPPDPDWGSIIAEGAQVLSKSPWPVIAGGFALALVTLTLVLVGDGIRDSAVESWSGPPPGRPARRRTTATTQSAATAPISPDALVCVRGLDVSFLVGGEPRRVVSGVDLDIAPGETLGIVGESGCGKTSVARAIARLLPAGGTISAGTIAFEGRDVGALRGRALREYRRGSVSYIAQDPMNALDPVLRVGTLLRRIVQATDGGSRRAANRRVLELLEQVQLPNPAQVARRFPHELSGGMAQRIGIARAIATRPKLLIADEPTTALDVTVQAEILALLRALQDEYGMAVLLVSHDWGVVAEVCDRAVVMYAGEIVERGSLAEVVNEPRHPYTFALLECRPSNIVDDSLPLVTIRGSVALPGQWPSGCRFATRCEFRTDACERGPIPLEVGTTGHAERCLHPIQSNTPDVTGAANHV